LTTSPEPFHLIRLDRCRSTSDYVKENFARLERDLPLMVCAGSQSGGRGREGRNWASAPGLGLYATFALQLADTRALPLLSIAAGVAVADMLRAWTGMEFALKWPNDVLAGGMKVAGILCENMVTGEKITCLVGIGINVNQLAEDLPAELRQRAASLRLQSGREWPLDEGRGRLAAFFGEWLQRLEAGETAAVLDRARDLSHSFLGREIQFRQQGSERRGICRGLADDGGLVLETTDGREKIFYNGEIIS
jgi:BirA family biotin operon repressor/biotin-[acetyl-CoA-carboxylase] ligase